MTRGGFIYGLWCLGIVGAYLWTAERGWSPIGAGQRVAPGVGGYYGPSHK